MEDKAGRGLSLCMRMLPALAIFAVSIALWAAPSLAQTTGDGDIRSLSIDPENPVVLKPMTVVAEVSNPTGDQNSYRMTMQLVHNGNVRSSQEFTFTLDSGLSTTISTSFVPREIGNFEMIVKLTDQLGLETDDIEISRFTVTSDIGPFDVVIEAPSRIVRPGETTPVMLTLANMGTKGTDVEVSVVMDCQGQDDIRQSFYIFVPGESSQEKIISTATCNEIGARAITASIVLYNKTWITALNQVFLNETATSFVFDVPDQIRAEPGKSTVFNVEVRNTGKDRLSNMRLYIPKLPLEWVQVRPGSVESVSPNSVAVFIVNITPPERSPSTDITIGMVVATDQSIERMESSFRLSSEGPAPSQGISIPTGTTSLRQFDWITGNQTIFFGAVAFAAVGGFVGAMRFKGRRNESNAAVRAMYAQRNMSRLESMRRSLAPRANDLSEKKNK